jgi:hypothetical protein
MWENLPKVGQMLHSMGGLLSVLRDGAISLRLSYNMRRTVNVVYSRLCLGYRCTWCSETCSWSRCKVHYNMTCTSLCVVWFHITAIRMVMVMALGTNSDMMWHVCLPDWWCSIDAVLTCSCDDRIRADHKKVLVLFLVICADDIFVY